MDVTPMSRAVSAALVLLLGSVFALFLIVDWRYRKRVVLRAFWILQAVHIAFFLLLLSLFGPTAAVRSVMGIFPLFTYNITFFRLGLSHYRDGRVIFSIITVQLLSCIGSALCSLFVPYGSPAWIVCWISFVFGASLFLYFYCRAKIQAMMHAAHPGWLWLSLIPASLLLYLYTLYVYPLFFLQQNHFDRWGVLSTCAAALLIYVGIYRFSTAADEQYTIKRDSDQLQLQMRALQEQLKDLERSEQASKRYHHDQRHQIRLLSALLASGDVGGALQVLEHWDHELLTAAAPTGLRFTGDSVLDAALQIGSRRAAAIGANFRVQMQVPPGSPMDRPEFALILLNAMENALNACEPIPPEADRWVEVLGIERGTQYFLSVRNTYSGPVRLDPVTTFPLSQRKGHGYGTRSIVRFAENHGGSLKYSATDGIFSLRLLFPSTPLPD